MFTWITDAQKEYSLDASASSDPDGDNLSYFWEVTDVTSSDPSSPGSPYTFKYSFDDQAAVQPKLRVTNNYDFTTRTFQIQLTVSDGQETDTDTTSVSITCTDGAVTPGGIQCLQKDTPDGGN